jgi:DNA-binding response OmpR family regulator
MIGHGEGQRGNTIILVEDDDAIAEVITIILQEAGYSVLQVASVDDIFIKVKSGGVCLLLLDVWFSGKNLTDIGKSIKENSTTKHIPIILSSASPNIHEIAQIIGVDDVLQKPFDIEVLMRKVKRLTVS